MSPALRIRQLAKRVIRTAFWLWTRRLEATAIRTPRSNYKATWQALSTTESDAKMFVASTVEETDLARSAEVTVATLERLVSIRRSDVFLEIGCGVGRVGNALAPRVAQWIGTDISANMLAHATKRLNVHGNVRFVELSGRALAEIPTASVDVVYCTVVFMHLLEWDRYAYVRDALRVLRPGGRCYFDNIDITTSHGWQVFTDSAAYEAAERPAYLPMTSSADELRTYALRAGFTDVHVHQWDDAWVAVTGVKPAPAVS